MSVVGDGLPIRRTPEEGFGCKSGGGALWWGTRQYILGETLCQRLERGFARAQPDGTAPLA
jgi:hypothetical protein